LFGSYDGYKRSKAFSSGNICFEIAIVLQSIYKTKETFEIQNIVPKRFILNLRISALDETGRYGVGIGFD